MKSYEIKKITKNLKNLLTEAVKKSCTEKEIGIIFSAGIDSTIIAQIASEFSEVTAYCVGIENSKDLMFAERLKGHANFKIKIIKIDTDDIENAVREVVKILRITNSVKVSVGVPFYIASKIASEDGIKVMLCGQGPDELFGGYSKYLELIKEGNYSKVPGMIEEDVKNTYENQLNNDIAICKASGIKLRIPYLDDEFKNYSMEIPFELKIHELAENEEIKFSCYDEINNKKFIRKFILRFLAEELQIPDFIINRQKKAAQYGSGTQKILNKIARDHGFKAKAKEAGRKDYINMFLEDLLEKPESGVV